MEIKLEIISDPETGVTIQPVMSIGNKTVHRFDSTIRLPSMENGIINNAIYRGDVKLEEDNIILDLQKNQFLTSKYTQIKAKYIDLVTSSVDDDEYDAKQRIKFIKAMEEYHPATVQDVNPKMAHYTGGMKDSGDLNYSYLLSCHINEIRVAMLELIEQ